MSTKRNAVILSGFMRNYEDTIDCFRSSFLTTDDVDVFIATWDYRGIKKINIRTETLTDGTQREIAFKDCESSEKVVAEDVEEKYKPQSLKVFDLDLFEESITSYAKIVETSNLIDVHAKVKPKNYHTLMRRYSMFYMSFQGWKLMEHYATENEIQYQKVIKARADHEKGGHYPRIDWKKDIPRRCIQIGNWNLQPYSNLDERIGFDFQDHFAIGNFKDMRVYFDMFNNLYRLSHEFEYKSKQWHAEYCLSLWLSMNGIGCEVFA